VNEDFVDRTISTVTKAAHTGQIGDGKIFVLDLQDVIRVGSGERGSVAIN
jgi:nitrogen regulatory protein P-II 1